MDRLTYFAAVCAMSAFCVASERMQSAISFDVFSKIASSTSKGTGTVNSSGTANASSAAAHVVRSRAARPLLIARMLPAITRCGDQASVAPRARMTAPVDERGRSGRWRAAVSADAW